MKTQRDKDAERFADYMIEAIERTGLKQIQVAEITGVSRQTISQIAGKKPSSTTGKLLLPKRETVDKIAQAFGDPTAKARLAAGYAPLDGPAETVEQALDATLYWEQKGLTSGGKKELRLLMEALDNAADRLAMRSPQEIVDIRKKEKESNKAPTSKIQSLPRKRDKIDEAIDNALTKGGKPVSDEDREIIREALEKLTQEKSQTDE